MSSKISTFRVDRCTAKDVLQVKFSDDTSLTGHIRMSETSYCCAVDKLVGWCNDNHLLLNVSKMKERVVDFRRDPPPTPRPLVINGEEVEIVGGIQVPGLNHRLQAGLVPKCLGPPVRQPVALLHEEAAVFQHLPQVLGAVLQVNSESVIQKPLSLLQPQRTGQGKTFQDHQDCYQADWQTCPRPPGTLQGKSSKAPGGPSIVTPLTYCVQSCRPTLQQDLED